MIQIDASAPEGVVIAEASGRVTAEDYSELLMPAIERAASLAENIRFLYVLGADFHGYEGEAAMDTPGWESNIGRRSSESRWLPTTMPTAVLLMSSASSCRARYGYFPSTMYRKPDRG
jgi:hypothetical protein